MGARLPVFHSMVLSMGFLLIAAGACESPVGRTARDEVKLAPGRLTVTRTAALATGRAPRASDVVQQVAAVLELAPASGDGDLADRIAGAGGRFEARDDRGRSLAVGGEWVETPAGPRLRCVLSGLAPDVKAISRLAGEILVYPHAKRIRFHIPWLKDEVPLAVSVDGATATLVRFHLVESDSTLWVRVRPPLGFRVVDPDRVGGRAAAMDVYGNRVDGGGIVETVLTGSGDEPEFRFFAPGLTRTPSRLMVEVRCVSGEPVRRPFELTGIRLAPSSGS